MLGRRIAARPRPPATVRDLEIALLEEWNSIPQSLIDNLIASMANSVIADYVDVYLFSVLKILDCVFIFDVLKNPVGIYFERVAHVQEGKVIAERNDDKFRRT
ncbi:hypothetical protein TNCV_3887141 [Trichonephila clavipes]|nr:hypothetical protein TNCV_3887141 [Trichonephila clavipes]